MQDKAGPSKSGAATDGRVIVLLLPELLDAIADPAPLRATLAASSAAIRVLLCLTEHPEPALVTALATLGVEAEILLGPQLEAPETNAFVLRVPPGTTPVQQIEFALALSDIVVVAAAAEQTPSARRVAALGKLKVAPGDALPPVPPLVSVLRRLDPDLPGWHACGRRVFGRLEQGIMELLAFNSRGSKRGGEAESRRQLGKCLGLAWRPKPYFAPGEWQDLAPDRAALDPSSKVVACFDALDRSALHGSYIHRDLIWIEYLGAAFAVFAAVAGALSEAHAWGIVELATLAVVALLVLVARRTNLQDRWTACRMGAEQLRIARMSLPLIVVPLALSTSDKPPADHGRRSQETRFGFQALAQVKRAIRDQGLPRVDPAFTPVQAADWLHLIVDDQISYHHRNAGKLEHAERRLRLITQGFFLVAIVAVLAHFYRDLPWLLLLTAAGPAFAAALHGTGSRLGIVHRAAMSYEAEMELVHIDKHLIELNQAPPAGADAWRQVQRFVLEAATAMGRENTSWHGLVRRYQDELP